MNDLSFNGKTVELATINYMADNISTHRVKRNDELGRITIDEFKAHRKLPVTVILDNVRSQHNIGSVFRTADSFIMERVILCGICATPPTAEIHKSALGAEFSVAWEYFQDTLEAVKKLKKEGYTIISIEQAENSISLQEATKTVYGDLSGSGKEKKTALIFGNEVKGVSQSIVDASDYVIEIPQFGTKHSLNISVSAGMVLWEFCKALLIERKNSNKSI